MTDTLLGICGALRIGSTNRKLMLAAAEAYAPQSFVQANLHLPLYDGDLEEATGIPAGVQTLAAQITAATAVIIAAPEYNKSITGALKNALDWVSRTSGSPWRGKAVAILSANDGREGGARGQFALRLALTPFRPRLLPGPELCVADGSNAFDDQGRLINPRIQKTLDELMTALRAESTHP